MLLAGNLQRVNYRAIVSQHAVMVTGQCDLVVEEVHVEGSVVDDKLGVAHKLKKLFDYIREDRFIL